MPNKFDVHRRREAGEEPGFQGTDESCEAFSEREDPTPAPPAVWPSTEPNS